MVACRAATVAELMVACSVAIYYARYCMTRVQWAVECSGVPVFSLLSRGVQVLLLYIHKCCLQVNF